MVSSRFRQGFDTSWQRQGLPPWQRQRFRQGFDTSRFHHGCGKGFDKDLVSSRNGATFIGRKTQQSLGAVPDISGAARPIRGPPRSGGESFWEEGDDFGVDVLRFHTCLTDILGFLEKLEWWFEQDIDDEGEEDEEGEGGGEV
ncbi:hypothetical protein Tco_0324314 [Tanacetum coccineum]